MFRPETPAEHEHNYWLRVVQERFPERTTDAIENALRDENAPRGWELPLLERMQTGSRGRLAVLGMALVLLALLLAAHAALGSPA